MQNAINKLRERRRDGEEGFTLIELMVVVLIIAILLAIAIPTFLGARKRAQDRAAQSSLRNALTAAKTLYTDNSSYSGATDVGLPAVEPSLTYKAAGTDSTGQKDVSVSATDTVWAGAALSKSGRCFWITETSTTGTKFGAGAAPVAPATTVSCKGSDATAATGAEFPSS